MILAIGGTKGGTGKSTVATNLTVLLHARGRRVLLVDADPQETSVTFTNVRNQALPGGAGFTCVALGGADLAGEVRRLAPGYQDVVIDTGGNDPASQQAALAVCDVYLVPFAPRSFDVWTLDRVAASIAQARAVNPGLRALAFLNRADAIGSDNEQAAEILRSEGRLEVIAPVLGSRKSYARAATSGLAVTELRPRDAKAAEEIEALLGVVCPAG